ncbi:pentatricopeptide repeat-containing protein At4g02750-like isoform X1 [Phragmites australis]|uniref:pentatricopeptide repeat-containing protein At4g02750-like isoform X1 n=1 Tax=Phragmites australis TaxID=29695 RepID=UPI002D79FA95|nr:pentatricopeptide repeat-containing protein At4g02750-like isoform X1 [Phragmites australis]XP_062233803.1 pentatricopeptide repeat-containing protein At4g02750-like isoform X1 [Phragmites australis]XP_062233804.1 pentatricopeptide repeat-containing protein At4g02750-like isoform X1 [Phragmites australis]
MPSPTPGLPRLRLAAGHASPRRLLLQSLAVVVTSGLSSSHPGLASRLLNSLLPHVPGRRLPALLRLLPRDHLTLLLLSSPNRHFHSLPAASALHALALASGHLPSDLRLSNSLLSLYLYLGSPASARRLLADIPRPDTVTWNTLLRACLRMGLFPAASRLFDEMPERDVVSYNTMLSGYAAEGDMVSARKLFDEMPERDVVTWNSMLAGYTRRGDMESANKMFDEMPVRDVVSWNSMLDGYAQAGDVTMSRVVFDGMPRRNIVSWNVILALYAKVKDWHECLRLFDAMMAVAENTPNEKTFVSVLTACGNLGDLERGKWVHGLARERWERLVPDVLLCTALLTMYAKCGVMETAREIFDSMSEKSVPSWNSMIIGYGLHGHSEKALELFLEMEKSGPRPNETTFICILSSCAHGGLVLEGWWCFDRMVRFYNIEPKAEHFGCMMDLLGRAGLLKDSEKLIKNLQGKVSPALWGTLISASRTQNNSKLGEFVGKKLIEMKPTEVGPYVLLSNIYAAEGRWDDVEKVREMMKEKGVEKDAGLSLVGKRSFAWSLMEASNETVKESGLGN